MSVILPGLRPDAPICHVEEAQDLAAFSLVALQNMVQYQLAKRARLDRHQTNLNVFLNSEPDFYCQIKLAQRLTKVERNIELTDERIRRLGMEILSRRLREENTVP